MNDEILKYSDFKGKLSFIKDSSTVMYQNFSNDESFFEKSCVSLKKEIDSIECSQNGHETTIYGVEIDIQEDKFVSEFFDLTLQNPLFIEGRKIEGKTLYLTFFIFKNMNQKMI